MVAVVFAALTVVCVSGAPTSAVIRSGAGDSRTSTSTSFALGDELSNKIQQAGNVWTLLFAYDPKHARVVQHIAQLMEAARALPALASRIEATVVEGDDRDDLATTTTRIPSLVQLVITDGVSYDPAEEKPFLELKQYASLRGDEAVNIQFPESVGRGVKESSGAAVLQDLGVSRFPSLLALKGGVVVEAINPDVTGIQLLHRLTSHIENYQDWESLVVRASSPACTASTQPFLPRELKGQHNQHADDDEEEEDRLRASSFSDTLSTASPYFADAPGRAHIKNATAILAVVGAVEGDCNKPSWSAIAGVTSSVLVDAIATIVRSNLTHSVVVVPPTAVIDPALRRILGGAGTTFLRPHGASPGYNVLFGEDAGIGAGNYVFVFAPEAWVPRAIRQGPRDGGDRTSTQGGNTNNRLSGRDEEEDDMAGDTNDHDDVDDWISLQRRRYPGYISVTDHELLPATWLQQLRAARIAVVAVPHYSSHQREHASFSRPWWIGVPQQSQSTMSTFGSSSTTIQSSISQSQAFQHSDLQRIAAVAVPPLVSGSNQLLASPAISARSPCTVTLFLKETSEESSLSYEQRLRRVAKMPLVPKAKGAAATEEEDDLTLGDICTFAVLDADIHSRQFVSFGYLFKNLYRTANELKEVYQMYGRAATSGRDPTTSVRIKFSDHLLGVEHNNRKFKYPHTVLDVGLVAKYVRKVLGGDAPRSRISEQHFGAKETGTVALFGGASQFHPLVYSLPSGDDLLLDGLQDVTRDTLLVMVPNDVMRLCSVFQSTSAMAPITKTTSQQYASTAASIGSQLPTLRLASVCSPYTTTEEDERNLFPLAMSKDQRRNALTSQTAATILTERYGAVLGAIDEVLYKLSSVGAGKHLQVFLWNSEANDWPPFLDPTKLSPASASKKKSLASKKRRGSSIRIEEPHKEVSDVGTVSDHDAATLKLAKTLKGYLNRVLSSDQIRIGFVSSRSKLDFISGGGVGGVGVGGPPPMRVLGVHDVSSLHLDESDTPRYMPTSHLSLGTDTRAPKSRLETFLRESSEIIGTLLDQEPSFTETAIRVDPNHHHQDGSSFPSASSANEDEEGEF